MEEDFPASQQVIQLFIHHCNNCLCLLTYLGLTPEIADSKTYVDKLKQKQTAIANANSILVVGGGPTGVEFAGMWFVNDKKCCNY